ncbi:MAG TPA: hypothetical protein VEA60_00320 [Allosphingosinicella sp.]|nr:hypothetical protein [Allosphingosinicella sp.]
MRIILVLAAAGMAAAAAAASAQPAGGAGGRSGISVGTMRPAARGPAFHRFKPFRPGPGHHHRRHRGFERPAFFGWGAGGFEGVEAVDPHGNGFFAGAGGRVDLDGGRPYYDYDRAYPYEWASAAGGGRLEWRVIGGPVDPAPRCSSEQGVRVCRGGR